MLPGQTGFLSPPSPLLSIECTLYNFSGIIIIKENKIFTIIIGFFQVTSCRLNGTCPWCLLCGSLHLIPAVFLYCDHVLFVILRVIKEFWMSLCQLLPQLGPDRLTDLGKETKTPFPQQACEVGTITSTWGHAFHTNRIQLLNWHTAWHIVHAQ